MKTSALQTAPILVLLLLLVVHSVNSNKDIRRRDGEYLILNDDFDTFNLNLWKHELTAGGGGNWEFEYYNNNRSNSYVRDSCLFIHPTFTNDQMGIDVTQNGASIDVWGTYIIGVNKINK